MEVTMDQAPTAAERLRSLLHTVSSLDVVARWRRMSLMDSHLVGADGRLRIGVPRDCALALDLVAGAVPVHVEVTDVAPVAMRDRVRARAALDGQLSVSERETAAGPDAPLVTVLDLASAELTERGTTTAVEPALFAAATPDMLASRESALLCHLVDAHADMVAWLSRLVPADRLHGVSRVHPLRVDRFGIVLRLEFPSADRDARLSFTRPLDTVEDAPGRMLELLAHARSCRRRVPP
jgi:hypothetical protein